jgi:hypothetical protein
MRFDELEAFKVEVAPATRERHLAHIANEMRQRPRRQRRPRLAIAIAALVVMIPVAGLASESALPGELLHPVKRLFEPAWSLVDDEIRGRHRIEELEVMVERQFAPVLIDRQVRQAEAAVGDRPVLRQRLQQITDGLADPEVRPTTTTIMVTRPDIAESTTTPDATTTTITTTTGVVRTTQPERTTTNVPTRDSTSP